jgi:hypothetical protein
MDESRVSEFMFSAKAMSSLLALSELAAWLAITYIAAAGQVWASALLDLARYRLHGYRENFGYTRRVILCLCLLIIWSSEASQTWGCT